MAEVKLEHITKIFGKDIVAAKDINLVIKDKEFVVLVGPSGCGKSTILRTIAGLEEPTDGKVFIDNIDVTFIPPKDRDVAMVFQNYALYPHMTVYDNMAFGLKLRRFPKQEIKTRIDNASKILGIEELVGRRPKELSGGQKQRVAVGRTIVRNPKVFLFDEPLSNLDAKLRVQMRAELSKLHNRLQATMIYVTHDQTEAMTMGDRIVVLKDGKIQQISDPINLYNNPDNIFVAGFIGSPSMNFIHGKITGNEKIFFVNENVRIEIKEMIVNGIRSFINKEIIWGIRPEHLIPVSCKEKESFDAIISVVEPMGNEIFLYLDLEGFELVARVESQSGFKVGENLRLKPHVELTHFFNIETGKKIGNLK
ncbi:sn-glycerol-3-phosphate ABC transporter ATP-binding protein UgpC [candidate division WOR-3 bacterium]|nr:sn-glycerol-3-phosphate ABC transporter ATP-binding protein UgpC [candidate division WOR-3 bacterium]